jgi:phosphohistidine phosphatase SixA
MKQSFRLCLLVACLTMSGPVAASEAVWAALREGGTVAMIRHARAPGTGDPPVFRLDDCTTQRNLSEEGRSQARRLGTIVRERGVAVARVLSSRWCRALDTARLAFRESTEPFPPLDSFFGDRPRGAEQTAAVRAAVESWRGPGVLALVTHQVNITALTSVFPAEGEIMVLKPRTGGFDIVGTVRP